MDTSKNIEQHYISKSYKKGLITFILLALSFILVSISSSFGESTISEMAIATVGGICGLIAMVFALIGVNQLIKGWKEVRNYKFFVALIGNGLGLLFFVFYIINTARLIAGGLF